MKIQYYRKSKYGVEHMYVADERTSKLIQTLTHQITLSTSAILALEQLGNEFEEVIAPYPCEKCGGKRDVEARICSKCHPEDHYHGQSIPVFQQDEDTQKWYCKLCKQDVTDQELNMKVTKNKINQ